MAKAKKYVLVGVGQLYAAPVGTTPPTHFTAPAGAWATGHVGYTDGGVSLEYSTEDVEISVDQELDPIKLLEVARTVVISTTLAQVEAATLKLAFGGGTVVPVDPDVTPGSGDEYDEYTPPSLGGTEKVALLFDGVDETLRPVRFICYEAKRQGSSTITFNKREKATVAAQWRILVPTAGGAPFITRHLLTGQP